MISRPDPRFLFLGSGEWGGLAGWAEIADLVGVPGFGDGVAAVVAGQGVASVDEEAGLLEAGSGVYEGLCPVGVIGDAAGDQGLARQLQYDLCEFPSLGLIEVSAAVGWV